MKTKLYFFSFCNLWAILLLLFALSGPAAAGDDLQKTLSGSENPILNRIRQQYRRPLVCKGTFTQTSNFADTSETTLSSGQLWLQGPDKMRWEYSLPEKQVLTSDGKNICYYTPELNQLMKGEVQNIKEARVIVNLLSELDEKAGSYRIECQNQADKITVTLEPATGNDSPPFEKFSLIFNPDELLLQESRMTDLFGNLIVINYKWTSTWQAPLPRSHFMFVAPPGCDIMPLQ